MGAECSTISPICSSTKPSRKYVLRRFSFQNSPFGPEDNQQSHSLTYHPIENDQPRQIDPLHVLLQASPPSLSPGRSCLRCQNTIIRSSASATKYLSASNVVTPIRSEGGLQNELYLHILTSDDSLPTLMSEAPPGTFIFFVRLGKSSRPTKPVRKAIHLAYTFERRSLTYDCSTFHLHVYSVPMSYEVKISPKENGRLEVTMREKIYQQFEKMTNGFLPRLRLFLCSAALHPQFHSLDENSSASAQPSALSIVPYAIGYHSGISIRSIFYNDSSLIHFNVDWSSLTPHLTCNEIGLIIDAKSTIGFDESLLKVLNLCVHSSPSAFSITESSQFSSTSRIEPFLFPMGESPIIGELDNSIPFFFEYANHYDALRVKSCTCRQDITLPANPDTDPYDSTEYQRGNGKLSHFRLKQLCVSFHEIITKNKHSESNLTTLLLACGQSLSRILCIHAQDEILQKLLCHIFWEFLESKSTQVIVATLILRHLETHIACISTLRILHLALKEFPNFVETLQMQDAAQTLLTFHSTLLVPLIAPADSSNNRRHLIDHHRFMGPSFSPSSNFRTLVQSKTNLRPTSPTSDSRTFKSGRTNNKGLSTMNPYLSALKSPKTELTLSVADKENVTSLGNRSFRNHEEEKTLTKDDIQPHGPFRMRPNRQIKMSVSDVISIVSSNAKEGFDDLTESEDDEQKEDSIGTKSNFTLQLKPSQREDLRIVPMIPKLKLQSLDARLTSEPMSTSKVLPRRVRRQSLFHTEDSGFGTLRPLPTSSLLTRSYTANSSILHPSPLGRNYSDGSEAQLQTTGKRSSKDSLRQLRKLGEGAGQAVVASYLSAIMMHAAELDDLSELLTIRLGRNNNVAVPDSPISATIIASRPIKQQKSMSELSTNSRFILECACLLMSSCTRLVSTNISISQVDFLFQHLMACLGKISNLKSRNEPIISHIPKRLALRYCAELATLLRRATQISSFSSYVKQSILENSMELQLIPSNLQWILSFKPGASLQNVWFPLFSSNGFTFTVDTVFLSPKSGAEEIAQSLRIHSLHSNNSHTFKPLTIEPVQPTDSLISHFSIQLKVLLGFLSSCTESTRRDNIAAALEETVLLVETLSSYVFNSGCSFEHNAQFSPSKLVKFSGSDQNCLCGRRLAVLFYLCAEHFVELQRELLRLQPICESLASHSIPEESNYDEHMEIYRLQTVTSLLKLWSSMMKHSAGTAADKDIFQVLYTSDPFAFSQVGFDVSREVESRSKSPNYSNLPLQHTVSTIILPSLIQFVHHHAHLVFSSSLLNSDRQDSKMDRASHSFQTTEEIVDEGHRRHLTLLQEAREVEDEDMQSVDSEHLAVHLTRKAILEFLHSCTILTKRLNASAVEMRVSRGQFKPIPESQQDQFSYVSSSEDQDSEDYSSTNDDYDRDYPKLHGRGDETRSSDSHEDNSNNTFYEIEQLSLDWFWRCVAELVAAPQGPIRIYTHRAIHNLELRHGYYETSNLEASVDLARSYCVLLCDLLNFNTPLSPLLYDDEFISNCIHFHYISFNRLYHSSVHLNERQANLCQSHLDVLITLASLPELIIQVIRSTKYIYSLQDIQDYNNAAMNIQNTFVRLRVLHFISGEISLEHDARNPAAWNIGVATTLSSSTHSLLQSVGNRSAGLTRSHTPSGSPDFNPVSVPNSAAISLPDMSPFYRHQRMGSSPVLSSAAVLHQLAGAPEISNAHPFSMTSNYITASTIKHTDIVFSDVPSTLHSFRPLHNDRITAARIKNQTRPPRPLDSRSSEDNSSTSVSEDDEAEVSSRSEQDNLEEESGYRKDKLSSEPVSLRESRASRQVSRPASELRRPIANSTESSRRSSPDGEEDDLEYEESTLSTTNSSDAPFKLPLMMVEGLNGSNTIPNIDSNENTVDDDDDDLDDNLEYEESQLSPVKSSKHSPLLQPLKITLDNFNVSLPLGETASLSDSQALLSLRKESASIGNDVEAASSSVSISIDQEAPLTCPSTTASKDTESSMGKRDSNLTLCTSPSNLTTFSVNHQNSLTCLSHGTEHKNETSPLLLSPISINTSSSTMRNRVVTTSPEQSNSEIEPLGSKSTNTPQRNTNFRRDLHNRGLFIKIHELSKSVNFVSAEDRGSFSRPSSAILNPETVNAPSSSKGDSSSARSTNTYYYSQLPFKRIYSSKELHVRLLTLMLRLLIDPTGATLNPLYCAREIATQGSNKAGNEALEYLHSHFNHPSNVLICQKLLQDVSSHPPTLRLVKLLYSGMYPEKIYESPMKIQLGRGQFAIVHAVQSSLLVEPLAVKSIDRRSSTHERSQVYDLFAEVSVMEALRCQENVVRLVDFGVTNDFYCIVMSSATMSLKSWRKSTPTRQSGTGLSNGSEVASWPCFDREQLRKYLIIFRRILEATKGIHSRNVAHFDMKCDNVLLQCIGDDVENWKVQLADFGESMIMDGRSSALCRGTENIQSPEMLLLIQGMDAGHHLYDRRRKRLVNKASDIWSLGCLLYELLTGQFLFGNTEPTVGRVTNLSTDVLTERECALLGEKNIIAFIRALLQHNCNFRPNISKCCHLFDKMALQIFSEGLLPPGYQSEYDQPPLSTINRSAHESSAVTGNSIRSNINIASGFKPPKSSERFLLDPISNQETVVSQSVSILNECHEMPPLPFLHNVLFCILSEICHHATPMDHFQYTQATHLIQVTTAKPKETLSATNEMVHLVNAFDIEQNLDRITESVQFIRKSALMNGRILIYCTIPKEGTANHIEIDVVRAIGCAYLMVQFGLSSLEALRFNNDRWSRSSLHPVTATPAPVKRPSASQFHKSLNKESLLNFYKHWLPILNSWYTSIYHGLKLPLPFSYLKYTDIQNRRSVIGKDSSSFAIIRCLCGSSMIRCQPSHTQTCGCESGQVDRCSTFPLGCAWHVRRLINIYGSNPLTINNQTENYLKWCSVSTRNPEAIKERHLENVHIAPFSHDFNWQLLECKTCFYPLMTVLFTEKGACQNSTSINSSSQPVVLEYVNSRLYLNDREVTSMNLLANHVQQSYETADSNYIPPIDDQVSDHDRRPRVFYRYR